MILPVLIIYVLLYVMVVLYVLALLCVNNDILLVRRKHPTFGNGMYSFIGGQVEPDERALQGLVREVREETGLHLKESDFSFVHVLDRKGTEGPFIALCFKTDITGMHPINSEADKHDDMRFFPMNNPPENLLDAHKQVLACIAKGMSYSEHGW